MTRLLFIISSANTNNQIPYFVYRPVPGHQLQRRPRTSVSDSNDGPRKVGPRSHISYQIKHTNTRKPKSRGIHACGVYGAFGHDTSKEPLEALRPIGVRVSKGRLHARHMNT